MGSSVQPSFEEDTLDIRGYRQSVLRTGGTFLLILLSGFTLLFIFYWRPRWFVALTHERICLAQAEVVVLKTASGDTEFSRVFLQSLYTERIQNFRSEQHAEVSETSPLFQGGSIAGEPTALRFFLYRNLKYIWHKETTQFLPIKGLDEDLPLSALSTRPLFDNRVAYLTAVYGHNRIDVPLTPIITKVFREVLTPFYIFQIFSVTLWMITEYYAYASIILIFSVSSVVLTTYSCRRNEHQLRDKVKMAEIARVLRNGSSSPVEIPSAELVPGDIVCLPPAGCEVVADMILISGSCIVNEASLTGESIPQSKSSATELSSKEKTRPLDLREHYRHVLFNGTHVVQAKASNSTTAKSAESKEDGTIESKEEEAEVEVRALVLRTGFLTFKGGLIRSILYPKPLDIDFTIDSFRFLSVMAILAFLGSIYTWVILDRYNLEVGVLVSKSLDILTIVVPPALPAVMTTGLFLAQLRLKKQSIFCINPSAINIAGTLNAMVFDKTGTLTDDEMSVKGVWHSGVPLPSDEEFHAEGYLSNSSSNTEGTRSFSLEDAARVARSPGPMSAVLTACHTLARIGDDDPQIVGDPLDKVIFSATNWILRDAQPRDFKWNFASNVQCVLCEASADEPSPWQQLGILRRFPFTSANQRQSVVIETSQSTPQDPRSGVISVLCKGSPETLLKLCLPQTVPSDFTKILSHFTGQGYRVLSVAWKPIGRTSDATGSSHRNAWESTYQHLKRENLERDLRFLGLVVLDNPVKPQSAPTIQELQRANFRIVMATGDNLQTAISVARQCGIIDAADEVIQLSPSSPPESCVITYSTVSSLLKVDILTAPSVEVDNPGDDEDDREGLLAQWTHSIMEQLQAGLCGLGRQEQMYRFKTSGSRRQSRAVASTESEVNLVTGQEGEDEGTPAAMEVEAGNARDEAKHHIVMTGETWNLIQSRLPSLIPVVVANGTVFARFLPDDKTSLIRAMQTPVREAMGGGGYRVGMCGDGANDCGALKTAHVGIALSDCEASIAAPFTSRLQDISCVAKLLREGRCSLCTAIGSFKYMVLYSFIQFFTVLLLYYIGNTLSDAEFLLIDLFYVTPLSITYALSKPWKHLEAQTPSLRLLTPWNLCSVLSQLLLTVGTQIVIFVAVQHQPWWTPFKPPSDGLENAGSYEATSLFYFSSFQYVSVCLALAKGPPFRDRILTNKIFILSVVALVGLCLGLMFCPTKPIVDWAMLLPLHGEDDAGMRKYAFSIGITIMVGIHAFMATAVEKLIDIVSYRWSRTRGIGCFHRQPSNYQMGSPSQEIERMG